MTITLKRDTILKPISKVVAVSEKKTSMPILSNLLISFGVDQSYIYATDLDVSAIAHFQCDVQKDMKILINGKRFYDILKELNNDNITISSAELTEGDLKISQHKTHFALSIQDPDDFPELPEIESNNEIWLDGDVFLDIVGKIDFALSKDLTRYTLMGMYIEGKASTITAVGTDGFRMAILTKEVDGEFDFNGIIIPQRTLQELKRVTDRTDKIRLLIGTNKIKFIINETILISRLLEGKYPDFRNIIPVNKNKCIVSRGDFLKGLKRVLAIMDRHGVISLTIDGHVVELAGESDVGGVKEIIDVEYNGMGTSMNFNIEYLLDAVSHIDEDAIFINIPDTPGPTVFMGNGNDTYINIIMPIMR